METEASLVNSPGVTNLANKALDDSIEAGSPLIAASVPPNTEIVQIEFTASSAEKARDGAQAFAKAFLDYRATQADNTQKYQLDSLEKQAKAAEASLKAESITAAKINPPPDASSQVEVYASRLAALQASIGQALILDSQPGNVVMPAKLPNTQAGINPVLLTVAAAIVGLAAGLALAIWRERSDDRVRASSEDALLGIPVLASLPQAHYSIVGTEADDPLQDSYRRARTGTLAAAERHSTLVVSAVSDQCSSAEVATNLSVSIAKSGLRVALVDTTLERDGVAHMLKIENDDGLSDLLLSQSIKKPHLRAVGELCVLTAGSDPSAAREFYSGSRFAELLDRLRADSDYVIVAAPPASTSDGNAVAVAGDGVIFVVADKQTTHEEVAHSADRAARLDVPVLGVIIAPRKQRLGHFSAPEVADDTNPKAETDASDHHEDGDARIDASGIDEDGGPLAKTSLARDADGSKS